jgi:ppGpp synthetase/RelA/SpoT-type nucleotidyltranferase
MGDFDEGKHPRDKDGKFGSGGGSDLKKLAEKKLGASPKESTKEAPNPATHPREALKHALSTGAVKGTYESHLKTAEQFHAAHERGLEGAKKMLREMAPPGSEVKGRTKKPDSMLGKVVRKTKYADASQLQDGTGLRAVVKDIAGVESTVANLREHFKGRILGEDNYISAPQDGGYRSHHMIVKDHDGLAKEIQVRTPNQNKWADWCHDIYKPHTPAQADALKKHAKEISAFAEKMSDHYFKLDSGKPSQPVPCPSVVKEHFGCLH